MKRRLHHNAKYGSACIGLPLDCMHGNWSSITTVIHLKKAGLSKRWPYICWDLSVCAEMACIRINKPAWHKESYTVKALHNQSLQSIQQQPTRKLKNSHSKYFGLKQRSKIQIQIHLFNPFGQDQVVDTGPAGIQECRREEIAVTCLALRILANLNWGQVNENKWSEFPASRLQSWQCWHIPACTKDE